ncbi:unnamed protein product [Amoebophrya sp. A25]|nr:unnamed protein product [Amoebophrya sp. A25]|eukprot:GSA25T00017889001.1
MKPDHLVEPEAVKLVVGNDVFEVSQLMTMSRQEMTPFFGERFAGQASSCVIIVADDEDAFDEIKQTLTSLGNRRLPSPETEDGALAKSGKMGKALRQVHTRTKLKELVGINPWVLDYGGPQMQSDHEILLEAKRKGLNRDRETLLGAVRYDGLVLKHADDVRNRDREIVLAAVRKHGLALEFAACELKSDHEIVLEAVRNDGRALQYADDALKNDPIFICRHILMVCGTATATLCSRLCGSMA